MTSFKFNFSDERENDIEHKATKNETEWYQSQEINPDFNEDILENIYKHANMFICDDLELSHVLVSEALNNIKKVDNFNGTLIAEKVGSDLVPGKYEGGLKIWECTEDTIKYFLQNKSKFQWEGKNVLDLGCGAGLLGIFAFLNGSHVIFQDYNKEVLEFVTIPNVMLNISEKELPIEDFKRCKFYSGDWQSFNQLLDESNEMFDYIITSETIYNCDNYIKLVEIFKSRLNDQGLVIVAAKTCYFGVGGGTRQFETYLKNDYNLSSEVIWKSEGGIQREILKINKRCQQ